MGALRITTCCYIVLQLLKLSIGESLEDPIYYVLMRRPNNVQVWNSGKSLVMGRFWNSVSCGEFFGQSPDKDSDICGLREINDPPDKQEEGLKLQQGHLEGSTIIYVLTRKETLSISKFLCKCHM
ncbi:uncharacterized protein LOC114284504 [Camellia sinensis]|uniref:uncharacterized protein LOC114284504 n=1 Tax=Camellia sinensis TaxID=4442 RepID=UPI0010368E7A|nr:uncharacterized protein LOC114284504 [Camellia sinensis]